MEPIKAATLRIITQAAAEKDLSATCPRLSPAVQREMHRRDPDAYVRARADATKRHN